MSYTLSAFFFPDRLQCNILPSNHRYKPTFFPGGFFHFITATDRDNSLTLLGMSYFADVTFEVLKGDDVNVGK